MSPKLAARDADKGLGVNRYRRHQPEQTLLYQLIEQHYPTFGRGLIDSTCHSLVVKRNQETDSYTRMK